MKIIWLNFHDFIPNTLEEIEFSLKILLFIDINLLLTNSGGILNVKTYGQNHCSFLKRKKIGSKLLTGNERAKFILPQLSLSSF